MDSRGQISAEYLFLILIFLIVLTSVTVPFAANSIKASENVSVTSDAQTAASTIANAVDVVYANGPQSQRTVNVYIPQTSNIGYDGNGNLTINLNGIPVNASIPNGPNVTTVNAPVPYAVNFNPVNGAVTKGWHTFKITWPANATANGITITIT